MGSPTSPPAPLSGTLAQVRPCLENDLVTPEAWSRVQGVASRLPAALTRHLYLECRLADRAARTDLMLKIDRASAAIVAGTSGVFRLDVLLRATPGWQGLAEMARRWLDDETLTRAVAALWLEFDLPEGEAFGGITWPRVFVELEREWLLTAGPGTAEPALQLLESVAGPAVASSRHLARALMRALPWPGALVCVGCDPARPMGPLRLCVAGVDRAPLLECLARLGWPESAGALERALHALEAPGTPLVAHLDAAEQLLPGLGLELTFARRPQTQGQLVEEAFLDSLVAQGLGSAAKVAALRRWPGHSRAVLPHEIWSSLVVRRLNHVKVRVEQGRVAEVKAYPCFTHRFWRPSAPARR